MASDSTCTVLTRENLPKIPFPEATANTRSVRHLVAMMVTVNVRDPRFMSIIVEECRVRHRLSLRYDIVTRVVPPQNRIASWRAVWDEEAPREIQSLLVADD